MIEQIIDQIRDEDFLATRENLEPTRKITHFSEAHCYVSELMVLKVLEKYSFEKMVNFPLDSNYVWDRNEKGIEVLSQDHAVHEYDELGYLSSTPVLIEVKASRLHGFDKKIERAKRLGDVLFEKSPIQLIFSPHSYDKDNLIPSLQEIPGVYCIDTKWSVKDLEKISDTYFN